MGNNYITRKLLDSDQIIEIIQLIQKSNSDWVDGSITNSNFNKKNIQIHPDSPIISKIHSIIIRALNKDKEFFDFCCPKTTDVPIVSKYLPGSYYNIHNDSFENGNFSTTIFLSDPNLYSGGELCLCIDSEEVKFKLPIGHAITYHTGIPHRVNKVIDGERLACVTWTKSYIKSYDDLLFYRSISRLRNFIQQNYMWEDFDSSNFNNLHQNPLFLMSELYNQFLRKFAN